eukprot:COSAG02_NODE_2100_length_9827_cov_18.167352_12_plen_158_part_00
MAKSPLMYGGQLPITDNVTLNLVTNELALLINSHSANDMQVAYQGDCSCRHKSGFACHPHNLPGAAPCVATWWSSLGRCKAVAVLNVGAVDAADVEVTFEKIGLPPVEYSVTEVYEKKTWLVEPSKNLKVSVPGTGGALFVVSPAGTEAAQCVDQAW